MQPTPLLLLVEDDDAIRSFLQDVLSDGGFELASVGSGPEAIAFLDDQGEDLRGLITDIDLGAGPDGWQVARHARELNPKISIVYMSGASAHDWIAQGVPKSIILGKPFAPAQIVTAISGLLNGGDASV